MPDESMRLFGASAEGVLAECDKCGRVLRVPLSSTKTSECGYIVSAGIRCPCGKIATIVLGKIATIGSYDSPPTQDSVYCPRCQSSQFTAMKKGFGLGKAAAGGVLLGPVGLLGGFAVASQVRLTCLKCGHEWRPGVPSGQALIKTRTEVIATGGAFIGVLSGFLVAFSTDSVWYKIMEIIALTIVGAILGAIYAAVHPDKKSTIRSKEINTSRL